MAEVGQGRTLSGDLCITFVFFRFSSNEEKISLTLACNLYQLCTFFLFFVVEY